MDCPLLRQLHHGFISTLGSSGGKIDRFFPNEACSERMTGWAFFACDVLLAAKNLRADDVWVRNIGTFLLHVCNWMRHYERAMQKTDDREKIERWFVLAAKPVIDSVVGGRHEHLHPGLFADVVIYGYNHGFQPNDSPSIAPAEDQTRRSMATDWILSASIELITNAISSTEYEPRRRVDGWNSPTRLPRLQ